MSLVPAWATWRVSGKPKRSCENLETASGFFALQVDGVYTIETVDVMIVFIQ